MSKKTNLSAGRQALRAALRELEQTALQGRTRTEAIDATNRRLEQTGLAKLGPTTVGGWFEAGSPAKDFQSLWALVGVLLEWSGQPSADTFTGPSRGQAAARWKSTEELWKSRWEQAKDTRARTAAAPPNAPLVAAYLKAARDAARKHPYPGALGTRSLPPLADVYVRQQARTSAADNQDSPIPGNATMTGNQVEGPALPATEVFREGHAMCVLLGGPGGGKSTLLRAHLADSADAWLGSKTGKTIPVMVNAAALAGTNPLPTALAEAVTGALRQAGLLDELGAAFFRHPPRAGVSWLVLVDGFDEIPDADTRSVVLTMLARAAEAAPGLYRFVVATRPLPANELGTLGHDVPRYELQPFSHGDLCTYASRWFRNLHDPSRHAEAFITGLRRSNLEALAHTPLMAFMLCQLYAADPVTSLPDGRTGAYESFVEMIYEQNSHKQVASTHDKAIRELKDRYQIPRDREAAEQAAQRVRYRLPELIDHLAYERINGSTAPAVEILALQANRPQKVKHHLWTVFLSDLLRPTGILTQRADDFVFLHQTLLEYHAARHATRDEQTRSGLLHDLIVSSSASADGHMKPSNLDDSYLGFLLDGLLAPQDRITVETAQYLEDLAARGGDKACEFLIAQVFLRTNLPPRLTTAQLTRFADDITLHGVLRVRAAEALARVDAEAGASVLVRLAMDGTLQGQIRWGAARDLAELAGQEEETAVLLTRLATDRTLDEAYRAAAARDLGSMGGQQGDAAALLTQLATDRTLGYGSLLAARYLARMDGKQGDAAVLLAQLATATGLQQFRVDAAQGLAELAEYEVEYGDDAAALLALLATDATLHGWARVKAAHHLAGLGGHQDDAAALLTGLAADAGLDGRSRVEAATGLAQLAGYEEDAASLLTCFATDATLNGRVRADAARYLARPLDHRGTQKVLGTPTWSKERREKNADLQTRLAEDPTVPSDYRLEAVGEMAGMDSPREAHVALLTRLAKDPSMLSSDRSRAVQKLAGKSGYEEETAALLAHLATDPTMDSGDRLGAVQHLAGMEGHRDDAAALLTRLTKDDTLSGACRIKAAHGLAKVSGYEDMPAALLAHLATDTALDVAVRVWAARDLAGMDGHRETGVTLLARFAEDLTLDSGNRAWAAGALARLVKAPRGGSVR